MSTTPQSSDPTPTKLPRKRKPPQLHDGLNACDGSGRFLCVRQVDGKHSQPFLDLCRLPELELERYRLGTLAADILHGVANEILRAIPDPNAAMQEADRYWTLEMTWRHWANAPAGHMAGLPVEAS